MSALHQIALTLIPGIGNALGRALTVELGGAEAIFSATRRQLTRIHGVGEHVAGLILKSSVLKAAERELEFTIKNGIRALFVNDPTYPQRLKQCCDAPLVLYVKGNVDLDVSRVISIVGTRNATPYGKDLVAATVEDLKRDQVLIVSGLAHGIDGKAHRCCLLHGIATVGVLGHGLDRIYPAQHRNIAEKMLENGAWVSEFPSGTLPDRTNFPKRNRIIAGLADATLVVEAGNKGGALITADLANSYDREVFAFPGNVGNEYSAGCNLLIRTNRAHLVTSADDIRFMLGWTQAKQAARQVVMPFDLAPEEQIIVALLKRSGVLAVDELADQSTFGHGKLSALLLELELKGLVVAKPGKSYELNGS